MIDENPYESGPVEPKSGRSIFWIVALAVLGLAGITCLPALGVLAFLLLRNAASDEGPPERPIPIEANEVESMSGESPEITADAEEDGEE